MMHWTRAVSKGRALGAAAVLPLGLVPAAHEAQAAPTQSSAQAAAQRTVAAEVLSGEAAGSWHTFPGGHKSAMGTSRSSKKFKRPRGVRVIQAKARCWGNDAAMAVTLQYRANTLWLTAKRVILSCNGQYGTARISNAGHTWYRGNFVTGRKKTVEYWVQYYQ